MRTTSLAAGAGILALALAGASSASPADVCAAGCEQASAQINVADIQQSGDGTNLATVQQSNQSVQQIGTRNTAANDSKQRVVYRGDELVYVKTTSQRSTR